MSNQRLTAGERRQQAPQYWANQAVFYRQYEEVAQQLVGQCVRSCYTTEGNNFDFSTLASLAPRRRSSTLSVSISSGTGGGAKQSGEGTQSVDVASTEELSQRIRQLSDRTFLDLGTMTIVKIWTSRREARRFQAALKIATQAKMDAGLPAPFLVPYSVCVAHKCALVTVTWLPPLMNDEPLRPGVDTAGSNLAKFASASLGLGEAADRLSFFPGADGCIYLCCVDAILQHELKSTTLPETDRTTHLRQECLLSRLVSGEHERDIDGAISTTNAPAVAEVTKLLQVAMKNPLKFKELGTDEFVVFLHRHGVHMQQMAYWLESAGAQVLVPDQSLASSYALLRKLITTQLFLRGLRSLIEAEVLSAVKLMEKGKSMSSPTSALNESQSASQTNPGLFIETAASEDEDEATNHHDPAIVNEVVLNVASTIMKRMMKKSFLRERLLPLIRAKFGLQNIFNISIEDVLLKDVISSVCKKLGLSWNAEGKVVDGFTDVPFIVSSTCAGNPFDDSLTPSMPKRDPKMFISRLSAGGNGEGGGSVSTTVSPMLDMAALSSCLQATIACTFSSIPPHRLQGILGIIKKAQQSSRHVTPQQLFAGRSVAYVSFAILVDSASTFAGLPSAITGDSSDAKFKEEDLRVVKESLRLFGASDTEVKLWMEICRHCEDPSTLRHAIPTVQDYFTQQEVEAGHRLTHGTNAATQLDVPTAMIVYERMKAYIIKCIGLYNGGRGAAGGGGGILKRGTQRSSAAQPPSGAFYTPEKAKAAVSQHVSPVSKGGSFAEGDSSGHQFIPGASQSQGSIIPFLPDGSNTQLPAAAQPKQHQPCQVELEDSSKSLNASRHVMMNASLSASRPQHSNSSGSPKHAHSIPMAASIDPFGPRTYGMALISLAHCATYLSNTSVKTNKSVAATATIPGELQGATPKAATVASKAGTVDLAREESFALLEPFASHLHSPKFHLLLLRAVSGACIQPQDTYLAAKLFLRSIFAQIPPLPSPAVGDFATDVSLSTSATTAPMTLLGSNNSNNTLQFHGLIANASSSSRQQAVDVKLFVYFQQFLDTCSSMLFISSDESRSTSPIVPQAFSADPFPSAHDQAPADLPLPSILQIALGATMFAILSAENLSTIPAVNDDLQIILAALQRVRHILVDSLGSFLHKQKLSSPTDSITSASAPPAAARRRSSAFVSSGSEESTLFAALTASTSLAMALLRCGRQLLEGPFSSQASSATPPAAAHTKDHGESTHHEPDDHSKMNEVVSSHIDAMFRFFGGAVPNPDERDIFQASLYEYRMKVEADFPQKHPALAKEWKHAWFKVKEQKQKEEEELAKAAEAERVRKAEENTLHIISDSDEDVEGEALMNIQTTRPSTPKDINNSNTDEEDVLLPFSATAPPVCGGTPRQEPQVDQQSEEEPIGSQQTKANDADPSNSSDAAAGSVPIDSGEFRRRLARFYEKHQPDKLLIIDKFLEKYKGNEEELCEKLRKKYGESPLDVAYDDQQKNGRCNDVPPLPLENTTPKEQHGNPTQCSQERDAKSDCTEGITNSSTGKNAPVADVTRRRGSFNNATQTNPAHHNVEEERTQRTAEPLERDSARRARQATASLNASATSQPANEAAEKRKKDRELAERRLAEAEAAEREKREKEQEEKRRQEEQEEAARKQREEAERLEREEAEKREAEQQQEAEKEKERQRLEDERKAGAEAAEKEKQERERREEEDRKALERQRLEEALLSLQTEESSQRQQLEASWQQEATSIVKEHADEAQRIRESGKESSTAKSGEPTRPQTGERSPPRTVATPPPADDQSTKAAATTTTTQNTKIDIVVLRRRLVRFYTKYQPENVNNVDRFMGRFAGCEQTLVDKLADKYPESPMDYPFSDEAEHAKDAPPAEAAPKAEVNDDAAEREEKAEADRQAAAAEEQCKKDEEEERAHKDQEKKERHEKQEAERKQREQEEADRQKKLEEEQQRREQEEKERREEEERKAALEREESEKRAKEAEAEKLRKTAAEARAKEEEERKRQQQEEADRKALQEQRDREAAEERAAFEKREREERERQEKEEREREELEKKREKEEADRKAREEEELRQLELQRAREDDDRKRKEEAERKEAEEKAQKAKSEEEAQRIRKEEAARQEKLAAERKALLEKRRIDDKHRKEREALCSEQDSQRNELEDNQLFNWTQLLSEEQDGRHAILDAERKVKAERNLKRVEEAREYERQQEKARSERLAQKSPTPLEPDTVSSGSHTSRRHHHRPAVESDVIVEGNEDNTVISFSYKDTATTSPYRTRSPANYSRLKKSKSPARSISSLTSKEVIASAQDEAMRSVLLDVSRVKLEPVRIDESLPLSDQIKQLSQHKFILSSLVKGGASKRVMKTVSPVFKKTKRSKVSASTPSPTKAFGENTRRDGSRSPSPRRASTTTPLRTGYDDNDASPILSPSHYDSVNSRSPRTSASPPKTMTVDEIRRRMEEVEKSAEKQFKYFSLAGKKKPPTRLPKLGTGGSRSTSPAASPSPKKKDFTRRNKF